MEKQFQELIDYLREHDFKVVTAESCTGGWIAKTLTDQAGSSAYFDRGFVTYSNESKQEMLDVSEQTLEHYGAVSEQVVAEMVQGALKYSHADIAVAVSGIAGPDGGSPEKPVGTVCFAWMKLNEKPITTTVLFSGDRDLVRKQSVEFSLNGIKDAIN